MLNFLAAECGISRRILRAVAVGDSEPLSTPRDSLGASPENALETARLAASMVRL